MTTMIAESKSLTDVWNWKEEIYSKYKNMPLENMISNILLEAETIAKKINDTKK
jgi:hypothetical protein